MSTPTPTPRTDAVLNAINRNDELERIYGLARALETELAAAREKVRVLQGALETVLASATPDKRYNPKMHAAWQDAIAATQEGSK